MKIIINSKERREFAKNLVGNIKGADYVSVTIEPHVEDHSGEQRSYFHILCRLLSADTGFTEGEIKQLIKREILGTKIVTIGMITGEVISSSEVTDEGKPRGAPSYSELIEGALKLGEEAGIALPAPTYRE